MSIIDRVKGVFQSKETITTKKVLTDLKTADGEFSDKMKNTIVPALQQLQQNATAMKTKMADSKDVLSKKDKKLILLNQSVLDEIIGIINTGNNNFEKFREAVKLDVRTKTIKELLDTVIRGNNEMRTFIETAIARQKSILESEKDQIISETERGRNIERLEDVLKACKQVLNRCELQKTNIESLKWSNNKVDPKLLETLYRDARINSGK